MTMTNALLIRLAPALLVCALPLPAADWPQQQQNPARTGRTADSVAPPYRARWIWLGPQKVLRNKASDATWPDDLTARPGYSYPMSAASSFTLADSVQAVVAGGKAYFGALEGQVFAVSMKDGSTAWSAPLPGGTAYAGGLTGDLSLVVFLSLAGDVTAFRTADGTQAWTYHCRKILTHAPLIVGGHVYAADHAGWVYALDVSTGALAWKRRLPAPVQGGMAGDGATLFVGAENMVVYALRLTDGAEVASHRVRGQSFRTQHPVVFGGLVWMQSAMVPAVGSEYVMDSLMADSGSLAAEEANIVRYFNGDTNGGRWPEASQDWRHLFAMRTSDLSEPFTVLSGPVEGCGTPAEPVTVDNSGRVLTWWKTRYPFFTNVGAFGTNYSIDLAAVNQATGYRSPIDNGRFSNPWPGMETDNLWALSVGGDYVWLRQSFRGTQVLGLKDSSHSFVSARIRNQDGGTYDADVVYADQPAGDIRTPQTEMEGRAAPAIAGSYVLIVEPFGIVCVEHAQ